MKNQSFFSHFQYKKRMQRHNSTHVRVSLLSSNFKSYSCVLLIKHGKSPAPSCLLRKTNFFSKTQNSQISSVLENLPLLTRKNKPLHSTATKTYLACAITIKKFGWKTQILSCTPLISPKTPHITHKSSTKLSKR